MLLASRNLTQILRLCQWHKVIIDSIVSGTEGESYVLD